MASIIFDKRRGVYYVQWHNGQRYTRSPAHRLVSWKPASSTRPARDPVEVTRALVGFQEKERLAKGRASVRPTDETVADFLKSHQESFALTRAKGSIQELNQVVNTFLRWCEASKVKKLDQVTPSVCRKFLMARAGERSCITGGTIAHSTLTKERALLSAAWQCAVKLEEIERNPWKLVEIPAKAEKKHKGSWSPEEYQRLLAEARPWLRDVIVLGCHCGLRITALLGLEWSDIRWGKEGSDSLGEIVVRPEFDKAKRGYQVPIHPTAYDLLLRRKAMADDGQTRILLGQSGRPSDGGTTWEAIRGACRRAKLPQPSSPNHHMRRTFGRWAVLGQLTGQPIPLYVASRWMGHATVEMTERYLDLPRDVSAHWMSGGKDEPGHP